MPAKLGLNWAECRGGGHPRKNRVPGFLELPIKTMCVPMVLITIIHHERAIIIHVFANSHTWKCHEWQWIYKALSRFCIYVPCAKISRKEAPCNCRGSMQPHMALWGCLRYVGTLVGSFEYWHHGKSNFTMDGSSRPSRKRDHLTLAAICRQPAATG